MAHLAPTTNNVNAEQTADLFVQHVFRAHGMPANIVTDRGTQFTGAFWTALCKKLGTDRHLTSAYHPQSNGQTERLNRVLEDMLRHYIGSSETEWDSLLPIAEFAINSAYNTSIQNTPFFLNYGRHPRTPLLRELDTAVPAAERKTDWLHTAISRAKRCLEAAQQRQKAYYDRNKTATTNPVTWCCCPHRTSAHTPAS
jgi:transposase InsO family protein